MVFNNDSSYVEYNNLVNNWSLSDDKLHSFLVKFCYNSGKIENDRFNYNDTRDIFNTNSVTDFSGDVTTLMEQVNQKNCILDLLNKDFELNLNSIKSIHKTLMTNCYSPNLISKGEVPGEFKKGDYVVGLLDVGSLPNEVVDDLKFIVDSVYGELFHLECIGVECEDVLKIATYFHAWFESIHPFADGNGRTGRMILNWMLIKFDHPPIVIFDEDKKFYYEALELFNVEDDLKPLFEFFKYECEKTWGYLNRKSMNLKSIRDSNLFK